MILFFRFGVVVNNGFIYENKVYKRKFGSKDNKFYLVILGLR